MNLIGLACDVVSIPATVVKVEGGDGKTHRQPSRS